MTVARRRPTAWVAEIGTQRGDRRPVGTANQGAVAERRHACRHAADEPRPARDEADARQDAIEDFSRAITLDPSLAEAYHQRAIARFAAGDTPGAIADIQATLQHEPRSFTAFQTLSAIAETRKDWKGAYEAWQKVLEIDPKSPGGQERLKDLRRRALGEEA